MDAMSKKHTTKCSFCSKIYNESDLIAHKDSDGIQVQLCSTCSLTSAKIFGHIKKDEQYSAETNKATEQTDAGKDSELIRVLSPKQIFDELCKYVVGQDEYLRELAVFGFQHLARAKRFLEGEELSTLGKKSNLLVVGKSGCGKTWAITHLARVIGVPVAFGDATRLTEMGYVGEDIDDILRTLFMSSSSKMASVGICAIDELDKVCAKGTNDSVTRGGVQQALLKAIEGHKFEIFATGDKRSGSEKQIVDTRLIPFIGLGAFSGTALYDKKPQQRMGFRTTVQSSDLVKKPDLIQQIIKAGFYEEFINRFDCVHLINNLSVSDMIEILNNQNCGVIKSERERFQREGINLEVDEKAIRIIATKAFKDGIGGARSLSSHFHNILKGLEFDLFGTGKEVDATVYVDKAGEIKVQVKENDKALGIINNDVVILKVGATA